MAILKQTDFDVRLAAAHEIVKKSNVKRIGLAVALAGVCTGGGFAATLHWNGGSGKWSDPDNWSEKAVPQTGDSLVFTSEASQITVTNDIAGLSLNDVAIQSGGSDATAPVVLTGQKLSLTSNGKAWSADVLFTNAMPIVFAHNAAPTKNSSIVNTGNGVFVGDIELGGNFSLSGNNSETTFCGTLTGEDALICGAGNHSAHYYGKVAVKGFITPAWVTFHSYFHVAGNSWTTSDMSYHCDLFAQVPNAFPTNMVMRWTERRNDGGDEVGGYVMYADQTIDRIESARIAGRTKTGGYPQRFNVGRSDYKNATSVLELRATASATCSAMVWPKVSLVYNPTGNYTQTFRDREHKTDGTLTVRGGTVESYGTNTFKSVTALTVCGAGTFKLSKDETGNVCDPFGTVTVGEIRYGGKIDVVSGGTVTFKSLTASGVIVAAGTYQGTDGTDATAERVGWILGGGLVRVLNAEDVTCWKDAVSGSWTNAAMWTAGVPTIGKKTRVTVDGPSYTVSVPAGTTMPKDLTICNDSGCSTVDVVGDLAVASWAWSVARGGEFRVSGGEVSFTGANTSGGTFDISGEGSQTGRVTLASGTLRYAPNLSSFRMRLLTGGLLDVRGGLFDLPILKADSSDKLIQEGGVLLVSGGEFRNQGERWGYRTFADDQSVFSGSSFFSTYESTRMCVKPSAAGKTARLAFSDAARLAGAKYARLSIGGCAGGRAVVDFTSTAAHGQLNGTPPCGLEIGCDAGVGEMNLSAGYLPVNVYGLSIGMASSNAGRSTTGVKGILRVTGGSMRVEATSNFLGWYTGGIFGTIVGYGANTTAGSGWPYEGELYLSGGSITNVYGPTVAGLGYAKGTIVVSGGEYRTQTQNDMPTILGMGGGIGTLAISGGSFVSLREKAGIYVGGCSTNVFGGQYSDMTQKGYPIDRHDAVGTLSFSDGSLSVAGGVVLGADGQGTFERIGSSGTVAIAGDLVFSNAVENAASGGTLVFRLDESGRAGTIAVGGKLKIDSKAKLVIDTGSGDPGSFRSTLLTASGGIEGQFAEGAVSLIGNRTRRTEVKILNGSIEVIRLSPLFVIIR